MNQIKYCGVVRISRVVWQIDTQMSLLTLLHFCRKCDLRVKIDGIVVGKLYFLHFSSWGWNWRCRVETRWSPPGSTQVSSILVGKVQYVGNVSSGVVGAKMSRYQLQGTRWGCLIVERARRVWQVGRLGPRHMVKRGGHIALPTL